MSDGWTVVRYGRGRQRNRQPQWDRGYGRSDGWKDRAPPSSFGRGNQFPYPSRPVPPPRSSRNNGPQHRSYAEVVRQNNPRLLRRLVSPRADRSHVMRQPAPPQFGRLVRTIHAVIKNVHHLQNVAPEPGKSEPRMISRMVEVLSGMVKPASPTTQTMDLIAGNAKNWGYTTCLILMQHYEASLEGLLGELPALHTPDWKAAFEVAVRWAKRNLSRLTRDEINQSEALITAILDTSDSVRPQVPQQTVITAQVSVPQPPAAVTSTATTTDRSEQVPVRRQGSPQRTTAMTSVATMTEQSSPVREVQQTPTWSDPPLMQRRSRRTRCLTPSEDSVIEEQGPDCAEEGRQETPAQQSTFSELEAMFDEMYEEERRAEESVEVPRDSRQVVVEVHRQEALEDEDLFEESFDLFTSSEPPRFSVFRHPNTQRKLTDWNLTVEKKFLIIGDSNLCSLPDFFNGDLQVDCFPGSHFRHAQALMEKTVPPQGLVVEKIVLSFGINSRGNNAKETTIKNLQGALRSTKRKFPYAEIWIPLVNFSPDLPEGEKENLQILNDYIIRNMPYIPLLPENKFQTELDDVHWTVGTGSAMLDHWKAALNFTSP